VHINNRPRSFFVGPALGRLSAKIAPLVQTELAGILIAELERHFNERVLSELQKRVEAIIDRELPRRIEAIIDRELPGRIEAVIDRVLPGHVEAIIDRVLPTKQSLKAIAGNQPSITYIDQLEMQTRVRLMMRLLKPMRIKNFEKYRFGSANDGGYICVDDFDGIDTALSFGIENNAEWDVAIAQRGVLVYQFDHTIDAPPVNDDRLIWEKKKIGTQYDEKHESLASLLERFDRKHLKPNVMLKIDIEHDEWPVFDATPPEYIGRFSQIVGEFHGFDFMADPSWLERATRVLSKIREHYIVTHVHANNHCGIVEVAGVTTPYVLEITFANRNMYQFDETDELFPGDLDAPCDPSKPDIYLGSFKY